MQECFELLAGAIGQLYTDWDALFPELRQAMLHQMRDGFAALFKALPAHISPQEEARNFALYDAAAERRRRFLAEYGEDKGGTRRDGSKDKSAAPGDGNAEQQQDAAAAAPAGGGQDKARP